MTTDIQNRTSRAESANDIDRVFDDLERRFYETFGFRPWGGIWTVDAATPSPALRAARADVTDTGTSFRIVAEIPGIPKDALEIHVRGSNVEIRGENTQESTGKKGEEFVHRERTHVGFYRSVELPEPVIATDAKAKVENGVLELELPKQHPTVPDTDVKVAVQ
jgi:HSP20 family protein